MSVSSIFPKPTRRAMVDVGLHCNISCVHCYYGHKDGGKYKSVAELKKEVDKAKSRGNHCIDFSGGEPGIYPGMPEVLEYCHSIGLHTCIITNGIMGKNTTKKLLNAKVSDFLVSVHGSEAVINEIMQLKKKTGETVSFNVRERQERFLKQLVDAGQTFRMNCTLIKQNENDLPELAKWAIKWKPTIFNFINFNPHHEWRDKPDAVRAVMGNMDCLEKGLSEAIPVLLDAGVGVNVRYYPMCRIPEVFRYHVCNDLQVLSDPYEWDYDIMPKTADNYKRAAAKLSASNEWNAQPCIACDIRFICGGINSVFFAAAQDKTIIHAITDKTVKRDDVYHYRRANTVCLTDPYAKAGNYVCAWAEERDIGLVPVFIKYMMSCHPDTDFKVFHNCGDTGEIKKVVDKLGYGIFDAVVIDALDIDMKNDGGYSVNPEYVQMEIKKRHFSESDSIEWKNITNVEIVDPVLNTAFYKVCSALDKRIEDMIRTKIDNDKKSFSPPPGKFKKAAANVYVIEDPREHPDLLRKPFGNFSSKTRIKRGIQDVDGKLLIYTICDSAYQWYVPMFLYSLKKTMPELGIQIRINGEIDKAMLETCGSMAVDTVGVVEISKPVSGFHTAAMRFLIQPDNAESYDYVLITDVDILHYREDKSIVSQHVHHMKKDGLDYYENYISQRRGEEIRVPGVHFVTREWWKVTKEQREEELAKIMEASTLDYCYDEFMLGRIIVNSGCVIPPSMAKLWRHHGVHIGDWRLNIERRIMVLPNTFQKMHIHALINDPDFMEIAARCGERIPIVEKMLKRWPALFV